MDARLGGVLSGAILSLVVAAAPDARATLGGDAASVETNRAHLGATRRVFARGAGARHDLTLPTGLVIRQYVSPVGAVYAIDWRGPTMPDLRELMGDSFDKYVASPARLRQGVHRTELSDGDLVVVSSGHRGFFTGRAWIPSLVPAGVRAEDLFDAPVSP